MARIFFYARDTISIKIFSNNPDISDLPINLYPSKKRKRPSNYHIYPLSRIHWRHLWTQNKWITNERLKKITDHWVYLHSFNHDTIIIGDTDVCFSKWSEQSSPQHQIINKLKDAQVTLAVQHIINTPTRIQLVDGVVQKSITLVNKI